jgi:hypothetical protein
VYLLVKGFIRSLYPEEPRDESHERRKDDPPKKKVSKDVGEYIDYEEIE